ncbi:MAG: HD domain-containing protein [Minisyncoccia bacterium]
MNESFPNPKTAGESEKAPNLKFAQLAPEVWKALGELPRTVWVRRGVENPETVQDHIVALRVLANSFGNLTDEEKDGLFDMLEVHDWPEAIHGDEVITTIDEAERKMLKAIKFENEKKALTQICSGMGDAGEEIMKLWLRFESSGDAAASFGRQLDKYQAVEKALEYEKEQHIPLFEEFYTYALPYISHPILLDRMSALKLEWEVLQKK